MVCLAHSDDRIALRCVKLARSLALLGAYTVVGGEMIFSNTVYLQTALFNLLAVNSSLREADSFAQLTPSIEKLAQLSQTESLIADRGHWEWNGIEIYGSGFRSVLHAHDKSVGWFAGYAPVDHKLSGIQFSTSPFLNDARSAQFEIAQQLGLGTWQLPLPSPVYQRKNGDLENWWRMKVPTGETYWLRDVDAWLSQEVPQPMSATAQAKVYRENKVSSSVTGIESFELKDLLDPSYLRSRLFRILNCRDQAKSYKVCGNFARASRGVYDYPFESSDYSEVVGYYSIQRAMQWHLNIQNDAQKKFFTDFGLSGPIDIFVRAEDTSGGGPAYAPVGKSVGSSNPIIFITTGEESEDATEFKFFSKDSDVYFHEFSHHVLYRSIKPPATKSEDGITVVVVQPRALQEGLADYFTYAMTGNNRLAESSSLSGFLREGNVQEPLTANLFDPPELGKAYDIGDVISSTLWKLRQQFSTWQGEYNQIDKITWDAIDLLPEVATLYQFACAVYVSAGQLEKQTNSTAGSLTGPIATEFADRLFFENTTVASGAVCPSVSSLLKVADTLDGQESVLPALSGEKTRIEFTGESPDALPPFSGSLYRPQQVRKTWCGVVGYESKTAASRSVVLLIIAPLLIGRMPRRFFGWMRQFRKKGRAAAAK